MKILISVALLIVIPTFSPTPGRAAATAGQGGDKGKNQGQQGQKSPPAFPLVAPLKQAPAAQQHGGEVTANDSHNSVELTRIPPVTIVKNQKGFWDYVFDWGPWVFSFFLVGVGGWQVWLLFRTLGAIKRQADTMERQEKILADSVAVAERSASAALTAAQVAAKEIKIAMERERPRIGVEVSDFRLKDPAMCGVNYTVDCWCPTPAFIVEAFVYLGLDLGENEKPNPMYQIPIKSQVRKTQELNFHVQFMKPLTKEILGDIASQEKIVWLWGYITYRGVQLSPKDPPYKTSFRMRWFAMDLTEDAEFGIDFSSWRREGKAEDNQQT